MGAPPECWSASSPRRRPTKAPSRRCTCSSRTDSKAAAATTARMRSARRSIVTARRAARRTRGREPKGERGDLTKDCQFTLHKPFCLHVHLNAKALDLYGFTQCLQQHTAHSSHHSTSTRATSRYTQHSRTHTRPLQPTHPRQLHRTIRKSSRYSVTQVSTLEAYFTAPQHHAHVVKAPRHPSSSMITLSLLRTCFAALVASRKWAPPADARRPR